MPNFAPPNYYDDIKNPLRYLYHFKRFKFITQMIGKTNGKILDIGCAGGTFTEKIFAHCGKFIVGIDIDKKSIAYAKNKRNFIKFIVANGCNLPFKNNSFSLVTCLEALEHEARFKKILEEAYRVLKSKGKIIVLVPNGKSLLFKILWFFWIKFKRFWKKTHVNEFSKEDIEKALIYSNFKIVQVKKSHLGMLIGAEGIKCKDW